MKTLKSNNRLRNRLLTLAFVLNLASLSQAAEGIWTPKADMPTPRMLLGTCVLDGKIYAIGGAPRPHEGLSVVEVYDPATDTWTKKADMLAKRTGLGVSVVNGKIYAIGGAVSSALSVEEYDPTTDTWTRKADMPTRRSFLSTSVVNGKIYAVGGAVDTDGPFFSTVEEYDPVTDTWSRKADLPEPRYLHTAGVVNGKIYVIAGSPRNWTASAAVFEYDPTVDSWTRKADAPTVRSWQSPNAPVVNGRIYVIGGDFGPPEADVEEYDPATDTWVKRPDMPTPRGALATTAINDTIYVIGGMTALESPPLSTVEAYNPNPLVVDFNGSGSVDVKDLLRMIECWGQYDPDLDIGPTVFGDGVVNAADLEVLMRYWGQEVQDDTLAAHWKLDEAEGLIAYDSAGSHDGTLLGIPAWQPAGGAVEGALELDGTTFVVADFVLSPQAGPFSVLAWIKGGRPGQVIVSQEAGADWLSLDTATGALMTGLQNGGRQSTTLRSDVMVGDGDWHRVGFAWDGSNRKLYADGTLVAEGPDDVLMDCEGGANIGCGKLMAPGSLFSGLIDDVRIYNRVVKP